MNSTLNPTVDTLEEISYWKHKNNELIKELVEYKNLHTELKQNMDYLAKEKFIADQKIDRIAGTFSVLDKRTRSCLDKVVECSTDLTDILRVLSEAHKLWDSLEVLGIRTLTEGINERISGNPIQESEKNDRESLERPEAENTFVSRGGKTVPIESNLGLPQSDIDEDMDDEDDGEGQYIIESAGKLSTIYEDFEQSSIINEGAQGQSGLTSSMTTIGQVSKNISKMNLGECYSDGEDNDMSTNVEASTTILENSLLNSSDPQMNNIVITPKRKSLRKSIGSPYPSSKGRTSLLPQYMTLRNSTGSPHPKYISSRKSIGSPLTTSGGKIRIPERDTSQRSPQFSPGGVSNRKRQQSAQSTNSPRSPSGNFAVRRMKKLGRETNQQNSITASLLERTVHDSSSLADYIKNTSTPIQLLNSTRLSSNAEIRRRNIGENKSEYAYKKRAKLKSKNPDDPSTDQENNILPSETSFPSANEISLGFLNEMDINSIRIAPKSVDVFRSDDEFEHATKNCTEESAVDINNSQLSSSRKFPTVILEPRYVETKQRDDELEHTSKTWREELDGNLTNSPRRISKKKKYPSVNLVRGFVETIQSNNKTERAYKKRSKFNSNPKTDEPSIDQRNAVSPELNNSYRDDGSLECPNIKEIKNARTGSRGELDHSSETHPAGSKVDLNDSSLRSSRRKKCPTVSLEQRYVQSLQRDEQQSGLKSTKSRRAVKKVVYKEPSMRHKLRRS